MSDELIRNPQMVQMICMPILASYFSGRHTFSELPVSMQNLLQQSTRALSETIDNIPLIDKKSIIGPNGQPPKPCAGCK